MISRGEQDRRPHLLETLLHSAKVLRYLMFDGEWSMVGNCIMRIMGIVLTLLLVDAALAQDGGPQRDAQLQKWLQR